MSSATADNSNASAAAKKSPMGRMNAFDRLLAYVAPGRALSNLEARTRLNQFEANAANPGRLRGSSGGMIQNASPETQKSNRERLDLMWDARDMEKNNPLISGILDRVLQYAVGKLEYKAQTGDPEIDRKYQDYFHGWCKQCDVSQRFTFREMMEIALRSMLRDGDYGLAFVRERNAQNLERVYLQGIEADKIGSPQDISFKENYIGGITIDPDRGGIVESYRIFKRDRNNRYVKDRELSPEEFIHLFRPTRMDEYRGRSWLAPALASARDLHEIFGFEKQGAKFSAMWAAFVRTKEGYNGAGGAGWDTTVPGGGTNRDSNGQGIYKAEPGKIVRTDPNEEIVFAPGVQRPSAAFLNLVESVLQNIASGLNLPYGFIYKMSAFGGVTARLEVQQAQRVFERWQRLLIDKALDRVKNQVLSIGIVNGEIPPHRKFTAGGWRFGAHLTADIQYSTNADLQLIAAGLQTPQQWCARNDLDYEMNMKEMAQAINIMRQVSAESDVPIEMLNQNQAQATELLAAMKERKQPALPPEPGLVNQGKDVKELLDVLQQVGKGEMDRESGIAAVMTLYGLPYNVADSMVPKLQKPPEIDIDSPIVKNPSSTQWQ